jgi:hypothetical protein
LNACAISSLSLPAEGRERGLKNNPNEIDDEFVGRKRSFTRQEWAGSLGAFMVIAFINGAFTLGFAFSWMAIYLVELFTPTVRATAASFVFNGARLIAWMFPIIAGQIVASTGGVARAALIMSSAYAIGLIVPFFVPETAGRPLPA